jgi:hypothetical protein
MKHRHLRTGCLYEYLPVEGLVAVEDPARRISGRFRRDGSWHSGDLRFADNHMVEFVVGAAVHSAPPVPAEAQP